MAFQVYGLCLYCSMGILHPRQFCKLIWVYKCDIYSSVECSDGEQVSVSDWRWFSWEPAPDLYFSGVINGSLTSVTFWDLLLNCVLFGEAYGLGGGKFKRVIYVCVFFQACHENSHSGNILKPLPICPFQTVWGVFSSGISMNSAVMIWHTLTR